MTEIKKDKSLADIFSVYLMEKFEVNQMHGHISLSDACFLRSVCGDVAKFIFKIL
jgi:hypothetical protein